MKTLLLILLSVPVPAYAAEFYVDAGVGAAYHEPVMQSGTWWQADQSYNFEKWQTAWRVGAGIKLTDQWAVQAGYLSLGKPKAFTEAVADYNYDFDRHRCLQACTTLAQSRAWEPVTGWEAFGRYTWHPGWIDPYVTAGVARLSHKTYSASTPVGGGPFYSAEVVLGGNLWSARLGGGLCWHWLCGDVTYYHGLNGLNLSISERAIVSMVGLQVPLWQTD